MRGSVKLHFKPIINIRFKPVSLMTFTKEEVYKDVQILNPGPGDRDKKCTPKNRDKRWKAWRCGMLEAKKFAENSNCSSVSSAAAKSSMIQPEQAVGWMDGTGIITGSVAAWPKSEQWIWGERNVPWGILKCISKDK